MKILFFILFLTGISLYAQDVITLRNGDEIKAKVTEISSSEIKYKRFDNLDGPTIVVSKSEVFAINYENGTRDVINSMTSTPSAQQSENVRQTQSYNMDPNKAYFGMFANPIGFFTFGPAIGAELTKGKFIGEFNLIFPSLGLLLPVVVSTEYDITIDGGIGVGFFGKYYGAKPRGGLYVGGGIEYYTYSYSFLGRDWHGEVASIAFLTNIGYKAQFKSGLYIRTGGYIGVAYDIKGDYWEVSTYYDESGNIGIYGLLDIAIGINFNK